MYIHYMEYNEPVNVYTPAVDKLEMVPMMDVRRGSGGEIERVCLGRRLSLGHPWGLRTDRP